MESENLNKIHNKMLVLLKWFHNICIENDIKYTLYAGTLIGAIREKGFIPWDDDIDVAMTRDEVEKLCTLMDKIKLPSNIKFDKYGNKIIRILQYDDNNKLDVWIDIFVYDYISNNKIMQKIKFFCIAALTALTKTKDTMEYTKWTNYNNKLYLFFCNILYQFGKLFNQKSKIKLMHYFCKNFFVGNKKLIHRSNDRLIGIVFISPKEHMEEYILTDFENTKLMVTKNYHDILTLTYGDYMTPFKQDTSVAHTEYRKLYNNKETK